jgi:hypothetical protein
MKSAMSCGAWSVHTKCCPFLIPIWHNSWASLMWTIFYMVTVHIFHTMTNAPNLFSQGDPIAWSFIGSSGLQCSPGYQTRVWPTFELSLLWSSLHQKQPEIKPQQRYLYSVLLHVICTTLDAANFFQYTYHKGSCFNHKAQSDLCSSIGSWSSPSSRQICPSSHFHTSFFSTQRCLDFLIYLLSDWQQLCKVAHREFHRILNYGSTLFIYGIIS